MDQKESKEFLKELLEMDDAVVLLMKGDWGVGKTYFWNDFVETEFAEEQREKYAYVSLFGKKNIEAIQNDILLQVFSRNKYIEKANGVLETLKGVFSSGGDGEGVSFGLTGNAIGMALSLFKKNDLSDLVICIDDFERKSKDLDYVEIMGFASILKERYGSKIVLIMDEEKIRDDKDIYNEYKEKLIDYEYSFNPNQAEIIKNMLKEVDPRCLNGVKEALDTISEPNLRTIKKVIRNVNLLSRFMGKDCTDWGANYVAFYAAALTCMYYALGQDGLDQLSDFKLHEKIEAGECSERLIFFSKTLGWKISSHVELHSLLWNIIHTSNIDRGRLIELVKESEASQNKHSISTKLFKVIDQYEHDVRISDEDFIASIEQALEEVGCVIFDYVSRSNLDFIFDTLSELSEGDAKYFDMYTELKKDYLNNIFESASTYKDALGILRNDTIKWICASDEQISDDFKVQHSELRNKLYKKEDIVDHIETIRRNSGWGEEDKVFLNDVTSEFIELNFRNDPDFVESVMRFIAWGGIQNMLPGFYNSVQEAIERMKDDLGSFRYARLIREFTKKK